VILFRPPDDFPVFCLPVAACRRQVGEGAFGPLLVVRSDINAALFQVLPDIFFDRPDGRRFLFIGRFSRGIPLPR